MAANKITPALLNLSSQLEDDGLGNLQLVSAANVNAPIGGLLYEEVITGSAVSAFSDIDLSLFAAWNSLRFEIGIDNANSSSHAYRMFLSELGVFDTTETSYQSHPAIITSAGAATGGYSNNANFGGLPASATASMLLSGTLTLINDRPIAVANYYRTGASIAGTHNWAYDVAAPNFDGLRYEDTAAANSIDVGSFFRIYRS